MYPPHHPVIEARDYRIGAHVAGDPDASTAELVTAAQLLAATLPGPDRVDPRILMTRIAGRLGDTEPGRRVRAAITLDHGPRMRAIDALLSPTCMPRDVPSLLDDIDEPTDPIVTGSAVTYPIVAGSAVTYIDIARSCRVNLDVGITDALAATVGHGPGGVYAEAKAAVDAAAAAAGVSIDCAIDRARLRAVDLHSYGRALLEAYSRTAADALAVLDDRSAGRGHADR